MQQIANTFIFPNNSQSLVTSLRQILDFISINLPRNADAAKINFKLKVIIAELLNNALKHTGNAETVIHVLIDEENIEIEKTDYGQRFDPRALAKLPDGKNEGKILLSSDSLNKVYAVIEPSNVVRFSCEENPIEELTDFNNISEHFGLLIISRSADEFTYRFDEQSGLNVFSVGLSLYQ